MWQANLKRQIEATGEDGWNLSDVPALAWQEFKVPFSGPLPVDAVVRFMGCVNDALVADRPRGTIQLRGIESDSSGAGKLLLGVRRSAPWTHMTMYRNGEVVFGEACDAAGQPIYPYFDLNEIQG